MMTMTATQFDPAYMTALDDSRLAGARLSLVADGPGLVLTGTVCNIWQYQTLRSLMMHAPIVIDVGIVAARRSDPEIADAVRDALGPEGAEVRARVRGGLVTLSGRADGPARMMILTRVGTLPGVAGIVDNIRA